RGVVRRELWLAGGRACRPLIARDGLGPVFIEPALRFLEERHAKVLFGHRLRSLDFAQGKVASLDFGDDKVPSRDDDVILAMPPVVAAALVPNLKTPSQFRAIVNAHFRLEPPRSEEHTSELQSLTNIVCRLLLEKKKKI